MTPILQTTLPFAPWMDPRTSRLPGILPLENDEWLRVDEAFAAQMAERDRLIRETPDLVHALLPQGVPAAQELYARVLDKLATQPGYTVGQDTVQRPDGASVPLDPAQPLLTLGRLVQEDLCLMQADGGEHVLTGAILCFPASWTLAQKIGRPLSAIHSPVPTYDEGITRRVQRMFDAIRPEQPLWRANSHFYDDPVLFQPRPEQAARRAAVTRTYLRSERQCLLRLPGTRAVVFTIHTWVLLRSDLPPEAEAAILALHP
jgi:hypothetical protein